MGARILSGVSAPAQGQAFRASAMNHGLLVSFSNVSGTVTVLKFKLWGRIAGGPWAILTATDANTEATFSAPEITAKAAYRFFQNQPVDDVMVEITTLTTNGSALVSADYKSEKN